MSTNVLQNEKGWLNCLSKSLSHILHVIGGIGPGLYHVLWPLVVRAWNAAKKIVIAHPKFTIAIAILILGVFLAHPIAQGIVTGILGFGHPGIQAESLAAQLQACLYGGTVPSGSVFSTLQSFGALA